MSNLSNFENLLKSFYELKASLEILKNDFNKEEEENKRARDRIDEVEIKVEDIRRDIQKLYSNDVTQENNFIAFSNKIYEEIKKTEFTFKVNKNTLIFGAITSLFALVVYNKDFAQFLTSENLVKIIQLILGL